jgi:hypothetical protein
MSGKQPMATILQFQPRERHAVLADASLADDLEIDRNAADAQEQQRRGEIVLFTGVRYSRWEEPLTELNLAELNLADGNLAETKKELAPAE